MCSGPQLLRVERTISECKRQVNVPAGVRISTECPSALSAHIQRPVSPVCSSQFKRPEVTIHNRTDVPFNVYVVLNSGKLVRFRIFKCHGFLYMHAPAYFNQASLTSVLNSQCLYIFKVMVY